MNGNKKVSPGQLSCIGALINKLNLQDQKNDMVRGFTNGRTDSRADMYMNEAADMIRHLKKLDPEEQKCEEKRRVIISMAHECGYRKPGTTKVDMVRLDGWCTKYGKFKKKLNQHNYKELLELIYQYKQYYASYLRDY